MKGKDEIERVKNSQHGNFLVAAPADVYFREGFADSLLGHAPIGCPVDW